MKTLLSLSLSCLVLQPRTQHDLKTLLPLEVLVLDRKRRLSRPLIHCFTERLFGKNIVSAENDKRKINKNYSKFISKTNLILVQSLTNLFSATKKHGLILRFDALVTTLPPSGKNNSFLHRNALTPLCCDIIAANLISRKLKQN